MANIAYFHTNVSSILRTHFPKYSSIIREWQVLPIFVPIYHQVSWGPIFLNIHQSCENGKYCLFSYQCNIKYLEDPFSLIYINHARMANIAYFRTNVSSILRTQFPKYTTIMPEWQILPFFRPNVTSSILRTHFLKLNINQSCENGKYCLFSYQCIIKYREDPFS